MGSRKFVIFIPLIFAIFLVFFFMPRKTNLSYNTASMKVGDKEITVRIADTDKKREVGLAQTTSLTDDEGMFFVFDQLNSPRVFWMKDMSIPIDIIWIKNNKVAQIDAEVPPEPGVPDSQLRLYPANEPVDYVLEVRSGFAKKYNIQVDTPVTYPQL